MEFTMAKAENIEMTAEEVEKMYAELHKSGELSDEELDNVAGGVGSQSGNTAKFKKGQRVKYKLYDSETACDPRCLIFIIRSRSHNHKGEFQYTIYNQYIKDFIFNVPEDDLELA